MAAHAVALARLSRIATRLKVFATLFIPLLPPLYRIRLLTALWSVLRACRRTTAPGPRESARRGLSRRGRVPLYRILDAKFSEKPLLRPPVNRGRGEPPSARGPHCQGCS